MSLSWGSVQKGELHPRLYMFFPVWEKRVVRVRSSKVGVAFAAGVATCKQNFPLMSQSIQQPPLGGRIIGARKILPPKCEKKLISKNRKENRI